MESSAINSTKCQVPSYGGTKEKNSLGIGSADLSLEQPKCHKCQCRAAMQNSELHQDETRCNSMCAQVLTRVQIESGASANDKYDALCSCLENGRETCQCRSHQAWLTSKWRPDNWPYWPWVKKTLVALSIVSLLIWLLIYLILHFYKERHSSNL